MKLSALAIAFIACALLSVTEGLLTKPRCQCRKTVKMEIPDDRIVKIERFLPGPHCRNTEIIATVKFSKQFTLCLNPNDKWVQKILEKKNLAL